MLLALAALGCSKKKGVVDPRDGLEGMPSGSQLIVYRDTPTYVWTFTDLGPRGPSPEDVLVGEEEVYATGPGAIEGFVVDFTRASEFEIFRREGSAFRRLNDFLLTPERRYVFFGADVFRFRDPEPAPGPSPEYVGRGAVGGAVTVGSPKTNLGIVTAGAVAPTLTLTTPTGLDPRNPVPADSVFVLEWDPHPGAAGYWVHVYKFTTQTLDQQIASGLAAPFYLGRTEDLFLGFYPAPGGPQAKVLDSLKYVPLVGVNYLVRVAAVDASGQLIAYTQKTKGDLLAEIAEETGVAWRANKEHYVLAQGEGSYRIAPLGARAFSFWGRHGGSIRPPS